MASPIRAAWKNRPGWSAFGLPRTDSLGGVHGGFDYYCLEGTKVYAYDRGRIIESGDDGDNFGLHVVVDYGDGVVITYAHLSAAAPDGMWVDSTTVIGNVGHTGNAADVVWEVDYQGVVRPLRHLHEMVQLNGVRSDPIAFHGLSLAGSAGIPIDEKEADDDMSKAQFNYITDDGASSIGVHPGQWFVRDTPSSELRACTSGQATDAFVADGISAGPFSAPNVTTRTGAWLLLALAEDKLNHAMNVIAHPWLAAGSSGTVDQSATLEAINTLGRAAEARQKELLAHIDQVDEATLATLGLKRI